MVDSIANELLNKTIYEITHSAEDFKSIAIVGSNKDVGKTEIAKKIFDKLKLRNKVCLLDLDYRKKSLSKEISGENKFKNFDEFYQNRNDYTEENGSLFIPSFEVDTPSHFFTSDEFKNEISKLVNEFDFILCDTPPWKLFVDAKIISKLFKTKIYIACNQLSTFKDIDLFLNDVDDINSVKFFYNKFNLYFNFLWYKYQYPYDTKSYYDYIHYSSLKRSITLNFLPKALKTLETLLGKLKSYLKKFF